MNLADTGLVKTIEHELRLPDIDPERCVQSNFNQASCHACVSACPKDAWILNEESLGLDTEACDGCGLCIPVCPPGALHMEFPWVIRHFGGKPLALFSCEQSSVKESNRNMPCVHSLGIRQLIVMHTIGINNLLIAHGDCRNCPSNPPTPLVQRIEQLNKLLAGRHLTPMKLLTYSNSVWEKIHAQEEVISRGTLIKRRSFLWGSTATDSIRQQMYIFDPLNRKECQTVPPAALLPEPQSDADCSWPWAPQFEPQDCIGCDACIHLCPTGALLYEQDDTKQVYVVHAKACNGCMICADVCDTNAIQPKPWAAISHQSIPLLEKQCATCGNPYHLPVVNTLSANSECPVCSNKN